jgi:hypothetical protein
MKMRTGTLAIFLACLALFAAGCSSTKHCISDASRPEPGPTNGPPPVSHDAWACYKPVEGEHLNEDRSKTRPDGQCVLTLEVIEIQTADSFTTFRYDNQSPEHVGKGPNVQGRMRDNRFPEPPVYTGRKVHWNGKDHKRYTIRVYLGLEN